MVTQIVTAMTVSRWKVTEVIARIVTVMIVSMRKVTAVIARIVAVMSVEVEDNNIEELMIEDAEASRQLRRCWEFRRFGPFHQNCQWPQCH